jgi:hypothetical protein
LLIPASVFAEKWTKFFSSTAKFDFFYSTETITYPADKTQILIWYKSIPQENAEIKAYIEWVELREVECSRRRFKRLQGRAIYENKPMEKLGETDWVYLEQNDLDIAFYNVACRNY